MNPKVTISIDAKNKAVAAVTGMLTVGAKVDVDVTGLPSGIPDWATSDAFTGASVRFRLVDEMGHDLARFPRVATDAWTKSGDTYSATNVELDTAPLRMRFDGVPFNEKIELGIIFDSVVDAAQYAIGRVKVAQWAQASTEDPKVLPDWREVLATLKVDLAAVNTSKDAAATSADNAAASERNAATSESNAATSERNAATSESNAATSASTAETAKGVAVSARDAALEAVGHYPKIDATNRHWLVWDASEETPVWKDTGVVAEGADGVSATVAVGTVTTGAAGTSAGVTNVGTASAAVFNFTIPKGDKGDTGEVTTEEMNAALTLKQDKLSDAQMAKIDNALTDATAFDAAGAATGAVNAHDTDDRHVNSGERSTWNAKQSALNSNQLAAVNSGITSSKVSKLDGMADGATNVTESTVSGWGFLKKAWNELVEAFAAKTHQHEQDDVEGLEASLELKQNKTDAVDSVVVENASKQTALDAFRYYDAELGYCKYSVNISGASYPYIEKNLYDFELKAGKYKGYIDVGLMGDDLPSGATVSFDILFNGVGCEKKKCEVNKRLRICVGELSFDSNYKSYVRIRTRKLEVNGASASESYAADFCLYGIYLIDATSEYATDSIAPCLAYSKDRTILSLGAVAAINGGGGGTPSDYETVKANAATGATHAGKTDNPHGVTAAQVGADAAGSAAAAKAAAIADAEGKYLKVTQTDGKVETDTGSKAFVTKQAIFTDSTVYIGTGVEQDDAYVYMPMPGSVTFSGYLSHPVSGISVAGVPPCEPDQTGDCDISSLFCSENTALQETVASGITGDETVTTLAGVKSALFAGDDFKSAVSYKVVNVPTSGDDSAKLTDRAINVTALGTVIVPSAYSDLVIRATVTTALNVTVPEGTTKYGDSFPSESGEFLVTLTKIGTGECYVKTLKLTEVV